MIELPEWLLGSLNEDRRPIDSDRRHSPRVAKARRAVIKIFPGDVPFVVTLRDVSATGFGLFSEKRIPIGQEFDLYIVRYNDSLARLRCIIRRCEVGSTGPQSYVIGAAFLGILELANAPDNPIPTGQPEAQRVLNAMLAA